MRRFIGLALSLVTGTVIGLLLAHLGAITLSDKMEQGHLVTAAATLVVALLIGYIYTDQSSKKRTDTELLLTCLREAKVAFSALEQASVACRGNEKLEETESIALIRTERAFSNSVQSLEQALCYCPVKLDAVEFQKLKDARVALKDSLTDSPPFPGPYDSSSRSMIASCRKLVNDELTRMAFAINHRR